jgi:hypothetical protein
MVNVVPSPVMLVAAIIPPWRSTILRQIANPVSYVAA